jgi:hypothetical protein
MANIGLAELEELFSRMREELDPDEPLIWGYVFIAPDKRRLRPVADELLATGYLEGGLFRTDDGRTHFLRMERMERHSPASLHARNAELEALATRLGVDYDGMEAGPAESA